MDNFECLPIDNEMIQRTIRYNKAEYDQDQTSDQARAELETLKTKGCLLYEDCRSCPKFKKCCPL